MIDPISAALTIRTLIGSGLGVWKAYEKNGGGEDDVKAVQSLIDAGSESLGSPRMPAGSVLRPFTSYWSRVPSGRRSIGTGTEISTSRRGPVGGSG